MKFFGREPAMILVGVLALVQLVAVLLELSPERQDALTVIVTAGFGVLLAVLTRPWQPSLITGGIATILTAIGVFGLEISPDLTSALNTTVAAVLTLVLTMRVSPAPVVDPVKRP
jgi:ABC-type branched-subunit amino acid transport system permease subunit